jgi:ATP phosphoribosyltransferase
MRPVTPRGFRDVLPDEARERAALSARLLATFDAWGYSAVETPVVEEYRLLEAGAGPSMESAVFKLFDTDGSLLALRPEMTVPIARLAAARMRQAAGPRRLCYVADVFREQASLRGQARQFTQAGIELVGASGPAADAEVILVLVDALERCGLSEFTVGVGTVAVLRALLSASGAGPEWCAAVMDAAHGRDMVRLDGLVAGEPALPSEVAEAITQVIRLRGGRDAIEACRGYAAACRCEAVVDELAAVYDALESTGVAGRIAVDFGILRSFDYYTGLIVEAYAPGLGVPLGGGGRYDDLLGKFGAPAPAAGFALGLERVHIALTQQGGVAPAEAPDVLVAGSPLPALTAAAARLRAGGLRIVMSAAADPACLEAEADLAAAPGLWIAGDSITAVGGRDAATREALLGRCAPGEGRP